MNALTAIQTPVHRIVLKTSPNYANFARPIAMKSRLIVH